MNALQPSADHKFSFDLRSISRSGERAAPPWEVVNLVSDLGGWGVSLYDDDLVPPSATAQQRDEIACRFRKALEHTGVVVSMVATDLAGHPVFKDGAFTSPDRDVRRYAIQKTIRAIDLGAEHGALLHLICAGHEATAAVAVKPPADALERYREAIDFLAGYVREQGYPTRFALAPGSGGQRHDAFLPTVGHTLAFIHSLEHPAIVGLSPEASQETRLGGGWQDVAQAIAAGKLLHIDLAAGQPGRHCGRDLRFGADRLRNAFFLVKLLEEAGYDGPRHFGSSPDGVEDTDEVRDFAAGCMRTYLALAAKARRFAEDLELQDALVNAGTIELAEPTVGPYSAATARQLTGEVFDDQKLAERVYRGERLNRLISDLLLGLR